MTITAPAVDAAPPEPGEGRSGRFRGRAALVAIFAISLLSIFGGELLQRSEANRNRAPELSLRDSQGRPVGLNDAGLPSALLFVSEDCAPCGTAEATLAAAAERWAGKIDFIVVATGAPSPSTPNVKRAGDSRGGAANSYGVVDRPALVLVTAKEQVLERRTSFDQELLERRLRTLIAEGPKGGER